jgi:hypothetical protein
MKHRLFRAVAATAIALGSLAVPTGAGPTLAGSTCTGWTSTFVPPTTIRVYRSALGRTVAVPFRSYVETVIASEWGPTNPPTALQAGALAVKQYGWYFARVWRGGRDAAGHCFDVRDNSYDQVYNPSRTPAAAHLAAVAATWPLSLRRSGSFFSTSYRAGSEAGACGVAAWSGRLYQRDAADCARRLGETAEQILRRFYGTIEWVWPGMNDMTGDGRGDVAMVVSATDGSVAARLLTTDPAALAAAGFSAAAVLDVIPPDATPLGRVGADVDGDGRRDLVSLVRGADGVATLKVMLATGTGFAPAVAWWSSAGEPQPFDTTALRLVAGDFNADRRGDAALIRVTPGDVPPAEVPPGEVPPTEVPPTGMPQTDVLVATSNGSSFDPARAVLSVAEDLSTSRFLVGDTTGDGRADLVILRPIVPAVVPPPTDGSAPPDVPPDVPPAATGTAIQVAVMSAGMNLGAPAAWLEAPVPPEALKVVVGDATRDGRDDLIVAERQPDGTALLAVYRAVDDATMRRVVYPATPELPLAFDTVRLATADFTGDGMADLLIFRNLGPAEDGTPRGVEIQRYWTMPDGFIRYAWRTDLTLDWATLDPL